MRGRLLSISSPSSKIKSVGSIGGSHPSSIIREFCSILASVDQEEYRSSGVQEFRIILNLERIEDRSDLSWSKRFKLPLNQVQWLPFRRGLNPCLKDILNS
jgi:hypothetical protein